MSATDASAAAKRYLSMLEDEIDDLAAQVQSLQDDLQEATAERDDLAQELSDLGDVRAAYAALLEAVHHEGLS